VSAADPGILAAGGLVSDVDASGLPAADVVTARSYRHDALPDDRVVVRLVPRTLGAAEDLALEFLGFAPAGDPAPVGVGARQALGFPAWALVHDPANGRHALAMVKDMARLARMAKSKPGNAKDGYEQLAARLDRAAPHFLPTFWEQAGRAFTDAENPKAAGVCFGKAREAERVHALTIDEDRLADAYLEYALAGTLPAKALTQYARDLAARLPPAQAYRQLRSVAVHRVAGGLAPHAGMAEELGRLARAAGLRPEAEARAVLAEVLALPAVAKAALGFWKSYRKPLVALAAEDPAVRGRLLAILPDPPGWDSDISDYWMELLAATGADAGLVGEVEEAARPPGGSGVWLEWFTAHRARSYGARRCAGLVRLVERMAPKLRAEGRELSLFGRHAGSEDLDVLDVLLAAGVPMTDRKPYRLNVSGWLADDAPGQRDLAALAGHAGLALALRRGIRSALTDQRFGRQMWMGTQPADPDHIARFHSRPALREALAAWLEESADRAADCTIAAFEDLVEEANPLHSPAGAAVAPAAVRRLAAADVAAALARTLRAGLPDELGWPEYQEAVSRLSGTADLHWDAAWPYLVVNDGTRAVVVGPDGLELEHVLRLPPRAGSRGGWYRVMCSYVDGQLYVSWRDDRGQLNAYWSGRPGEVFEPKAGPSHLPYRRTGTTLPVPGGGATTGGRPWHAGDQTQPARYLVASDGANVWRLEPEGPVGSQRWRWREYDPTTGAAGRYSQPRFFADGGDEVVADACALLPAPGIKGSPLGHSGDLVGWRVQRGPDGAVTGVGVDGRQVQLPLANQQTLVAAVTVPGSDQPRAVTADKPVWDWPVVTICEPGSGLPAARVRTGRAAPPPGWWHWTRPRDEAGSKALRGLSDKQARRLLESCADLPLSEEDDTHAGAVNAVRAQLPAIRDERLRAAVAREVTRAVRIARWLSSFKEYADEVPAVRRPALPVDDGVLGSAVGGLLPFAGYRFYAGGRSGSRTSLAVKAIADVADLLHARRSDAELPTRLLDWPMLLGFEGALALRAVSPAFTEAQRAALLGMLDELGRGGFAGCAGQLRVLRLSGTSRQPPGAATVLHRNRRGGLVVTDVLAEAYGHGDPWQVRAVELNTAGRFGAVPGMSIEEDRRPAGWGDCDRIRRLLALAAERGTVPWRPGLVEDLVARTGMMRAEAVLLLAGAPHVASWEANFLPRETRALLGLSAAEARAARDALRELPADALGALLAAGMPDDPVQLWETGPDVERMAQVWTEMFGRRPVIAEDVLAEANRVVPGDKGIEIVRGLVEPVSCAWMNPGALSEQVLPAIAVGLAWLAYRLPAGDPLRPALPVAHQRVRQAIVDKSFTIDLGYRRHDLPGHPALRLVERGPDWWRYKLAPARLSGPDDPVLRMFGHHPRVAALAMLLSPRPANLLPVPGNGVPAGRYPQDPRTCVPELVAEAAARYGLGPDAAAYYLQLLALPDPSDRNVQRWTGWPASAMGRLGAELVGAGLVVEAKRERAGRKLFLPGGWFGLKAPDLPVEVWKADLYGLDGEGRPPLGVLVVTTPVPDLFRAAWQRVTAGDEPRLRSLGEAR
jgi:hypothetical protein